MSKQSEAKEAQGYTSEPASCVNCVHFQFERRMVKSPFGERYNHEEDRELRCALGGFKVHKTAFCHEFARKPAEA